MKTPLSEVYKELDAVTDRLSTQVRTVALGVLAMCWLFLSGDKSAPALPVRTHAAQFVWIASICVLALLADLLQYQFGYLFANRDDRNRELYLTVMAFDVPTPRP